MERPMFRVLMAMTFVVGLFVFVPATKTYAQDKKSTCEFGADDQRLKGAERKKFLARCMANEDAPKKKAKLKAKKKEETKTGG
jgi:hypothetical protein